MYRDINKIFYKDSIVYVKKFNNLDHFLEEVIDCNGINPIFSSKSSTNGDKSFTGTDSYEEAWNLCRFTMNQGFSQFYQKFQSLKYKMSFEEKKEDVYSVVGYVPNVPRYLLGIPTNMRSYRNLQANETISIYMNMAYSCYQTHSQIENRGVLVLNLISFLENKGYHINLFTYDFSECENEKILMIVPIKTKDEKLNIKKAYFPLVHPSFLRRLLFRAEEKMPVKNRMWNHGYGCPVEYRKAIDFFEYDSQDFSQEKTLYISTPNEIGINGANIDEDFEAFIEALNTYYQKSEERRKQKEKQKHF